MRRDTNMTLPLSVAAALIFAFTLGFAVAKNDIPLSMPSGTDPRMEIDDGKDKTDAQTGEATDAKPPEANDIVNKDGLIDDLYDAENGLGGTDDAARQDADQTPVTEAAAEMSLPDFEVPPELDKTKVRDAVALSLASSGIDDVSSSTATVSKPKVETGPSGNKRMTFVVRFAGPDAIIVCDVTADDFDGEWLVHSTASRLAIE